jgi:hypothetical protein
MLRLYLAIFDHSKKSQQSSHDGDLQTAMRLCSVPLSRNCLEVTKALENTLEKSITKYQVYIFS